MNAYLYCYNDAVNLFDADGAKPEVVRNNTTVDPGGGGSAKRIANEAQNKASTKKPQGEAIVVSGSEKTKGRFKYNFIETGIKGIRDYKEQGIENITWMVFTPNYSPTDLNNFANTAKSLDVKLVRVDNNQQFINYLNTGNKYKQNGTRENKITNMVIYGHGDKGKMMLDVKNSLEAVPSEGSNAVTLTQLNGVVFDNTKTVIYTCQAANPNDDGNILAQIMSNITHGETKAMYGKVEYEYIAYSKQESRNKKITKWGLLAADVLYAVDTINTIFPNPIIPPSPTTLLSPENRLMIAGVLANATLERRKDDEVETLRKEFGYMQGGSRYDPIEGKQAEGFLGLFRKSSYWKTFQPE